MWMFIIIIQHAPKTFRNGGWGLLWVERVRKNTMAKEKKLRHETSNLFQRSRQWSWSVGKKKKHLLAATGVRQAVWEAKERVDREVRYLDSRTPGWNIWGEEKKTRWEEIQQPDSNWKLRVRGSGVRVGNICSVYSLIQQKMSGWSIFSAP